jgi:4-hydroxybenzoate polyprenyltransferase
MDNKFTSAINDYIALARLNRPVGIYLLLAPTLWALWMAAQGNPSIKLIIVFTLGVIIMRSAGCVINDVADRHVDPHVARTKNRPIAAGRITVLSAIIFFTILCYFAFVLVFLFTNKLTLVLSLGGIALTIIYPFMKRFTYLPQVILGAAFGWSIPMAFAAQANALPPYVWLLYIANLLWTVAYDTQYAMVDRADDINIGVKSTAILFGDLDVFAISLLQLLFLITMVLLGVQLHRGLFYIVSLIVAALFFIYQYRLIRNREPSACLKAFLNNQWVGASIFVGLLLDYV